MAAMRRIFHRRRYFTSRQLIAAGCAGLALTAGLMLRPRHAAGAERKPSYHSYSIPDYGGEERILNVFQAADGHLVLQFFYVDHDVAKVDYFDTSSGKSLFPGQEVAMAKDSALALHLLPAGLKPLTPETQFKARNGASVHADFEGGSRCGFPYALPITIDPPGDKPEVRIELFEERAKPGFWKGACNGEPVALHYEETGYRLFYPGGGGFLADTDTRHLIWIGLDGHCDLSADNDDIIAVPYEEMREILFDGANDSEGPDADNFARVETFIQAHALHSVVAKSGSGG
jgi:hypothetical protein